MIMATKVVYPKWDQKVIPHGARCQETSGFVNGDYIRCGAPAIAIVGTKDPQPYYMCLPHSAHTVQNRGGKYIIPPQETIVMPPAKKAVPASLRQKMAASTTGARPSLLPPGIGGRPEIIEEKIKEAEEKSPDINDVMEAGKDRTQLRKLIEAQVAINSQLKALEREKELYDKGIKDILNQYGIGSMKCDGASLSYFVNARKTIKAELLVAAGVPLTTISECTITSTSKTLVIRASKE
jgi:hypothetical protein